MDSTPQNPKKHTVSKKTGLLFYKGANKCQQQLNKKKAAISRLLKIKPEVLF
jgi:hypothetical protein